MSVLSVIGKLSFSDSFVVFCLMHCVCACVANVAVRLSTHFASARVAYCTLNAGRWL